MTGYLERPAPSGLADVIEIILDKGIVIDAYARVSALGIELLTIDARIVIASVDTYLRFAEATNRLDLYEEGGQTLPELAEKATERTADKVAGKVVEKKVGGVVDKVTDNPVTGAVGKVADSVTNNPVTDVIEKATDAGSSIAKKAIGVVTPDQD